MGIIEISLMALFFIGAISGNLYLMQALKNTDSNILF